MTRPVMLVILDGWGWRDDPADNAVRCARTPHFDRLWAASPHAFLRTDGAAVGLPAGQFGNSEVGHLNIGAGRVVMQDLPRIDHAVAGGMLADLPALRDLVAALRNTGGACHLLGLLSRGGVHAHETHALALARTVCAAGVPVVVHAFTDGRDTAPRVADGDLARFLAVLPKGARLGSVCGRYFAMDRDNRWDRVARAFRAIVSADAPRFDRVADAVAAAYADGISDEFIPPAVLGDYAGLRDGDAVLAFNFRADRIRQLMTALVDPDFTGFPRARRPHLAAAAGLTRYSDALAPHVSALFPPERPADILGEVVAAAGLRQLRMAETEKYPHVTYFLNGGREAPFPGEERILVPSPKVATYDLQPEMSAPELTDRAVAAIGQGGFDLIILNYANPDMVGHTGDLAATVRAVEVVDAGLGRLGAAVAAAGGALLVTADHGNSEVMRDPDTGEPHKAHTLNPVPVMVAGGPAGAALRDGRLADLAPTLLQLLHLPQPAAMTGVSLLDAPPAA